MAITDPNEQHIQFPPVDFGQLRVVVKRMRTGELDLPVGKKSFAALSAMTEQPEVVALSNIVELSNRFSISPASITRLAKLLGFSGFNSFQNVFKNTQAMTTDFYSENLTNLFALRGTNTQHFLQQQADLLCQALQETVTGFDSAELEAAAKLLIVHKRVYLFGFRQPASIASMLRYGLSTLRGNVHMFSQGDHGAALAVSQLRPEDLLVVISHAPYSHVTVKTAALAKSIKCKIIAITDSQDSPLSDYANVTLIIPPVPHFYINSQIMHTFFIENLLNTTAAIMGKTAVDNIRRYEHLLNEFNVNT